MRTSLLSLPLVACLLGSALPPPSPGPAAPLHKSAQPPDATKDPPRPLAERARLAAIILFYILTQQQQVGN